jgi:hypothetical protein
MRARCRAGAGQHAVLARPRWRAFLPCHAPLHPSIDSRAVLSGCPSRPFPPPLSNSQNLHPARNPLLTTACAISSAYLLPRRISRPRRETRGGRPAVTAAVRRCPRQPHRCPPPTPCHHVFSACFLVSNPMSRLTMLVVSRDWHSRAQAWVRPLEHWHSRPPCLRACSSYAAAGVMDMMKPPTPAWLKSTFGFCFRCPFQSACLRNFTHPPPPPPSPCSACCSGATPVLQLARIFAAAAIPATIVSFSKTFDERFSSHHTSTPATPPSPPPSLPLPPPPSPFALAPPCTYSCWRAAAAATTSAC